MRCFMAQMQSADWAYVLNLERGYLKNIQTVQAVGWRAQFSENSCANLAAILHFKAYKYLT